MTIQNKAYYMITIDPLHNGSGGISLGKVDNAINLDPATRLPKPVGTGISGANKYFTDLRILDMEKQDSSFLIGRKKPGEWCASTRGKCGNGCLICYTFGYTTDYGESSKGVLSFCDAHLLLFPIFSSMYGQVWITSDRIFNDYFSPTPTLDLQGFNVKTNLSDSPVPGRMEAGGILFCVENGGIPNSHLWQAFSNLCDFADMAKKLIVVPDGQFPFLVQKNLEQRTSVAIDPETGAAKEGALFTFEAVPEKTVFTFQINMNEYKANQSPFKKHLAAVNKIKKELRMADDSEFGPLDLIKLGFEGIEKFGMGGMNTRGFGRLKIIER